jgi:hypothetical protein
MELSMSADNRTMRVRGRQVSILEQLAHEHNRPIGNMLEVALDAGFAALARPHQSIDERAVISPPMFYAGSRSPR